jgi:hypothetical protein
MIITINLPANGPFDPLSILNLINGCNKISIRYTRLATETL